MIESGDKMDEVSTSIFAIKADTHTPAHFLTDADGIDATPPALAKFTTAKSAEKFCQNAAKQLGQAGAELTLNKE